MRLTAKLFALALGCTVACGGGNDGLYLVSGTVTTTDAQGHKVPLPGVTVGLKEQFADPTATVQPLAVNTNSVTDAQGHYGVKTLPGNFALDAALEGYTFTPARAFVTVVGQDVGNLDFEAAPSATSTP